MKLRIFSDQSYILPGIQPTGILYPLWKSLYSSRLESWISAYDRYVETGDSLFELTSLADADVAILPIDWRIVRGDSWRASLNLEVKALATEFATTVKQAGKPLVVFFGSECSDEALPFEADFVFRQSVYQSRLTSSKDWMFPFFCEDFVPHFLNHQLPLRQKQENPVVGFCGFARPVSLKRRFQTPIYHAYMLAKQGRLSVSPYRGEALRFSALQDLAQHPEIESNFIIRDRAIFFEASDLTQKQQVRQEYVQNLINSDYIFCCRGSGNYSNRFYEALCCGRIPVFLNTDCKLPWDSQIDWRKYCVWVEESELPNLAEKILEFHHRLSAQDFIDLQYACRELWQTWLSAEGFYSQVQRLLCNHFQANPPLMTQEI